MNELHDQCSQLQRRRWSLTVIQASLQLHVLVRQPCARTRVLVEDQVTKGKRSLLSHFATWVSKIPVLPNSISGFLIKIFFFGHGFPTILILIVIPYNRKFILGSISILIYNGGEKRSFCSNISHLFTRTRIGNSSSRTRTVISLLFTSPSLLRNTLYKHCRCIDGIGIVNRFTVR